MADRVAARASKAIVFIGSPQDRVAAVVHPRSERYNLKLTLRQEESYGKNREFGKGA
jgi:hypothetical protein